MNLKNIGFLRPIASGIDCLRYGLTCGAALLCLTFTATDIRAAAPETPCDPEYMDSLEARAWLEAQREISQNQNLIFKPDSVLEYTCFNFFLNEAASNFPENRQFSETDRWGGHPVGFSNLTTDAALQLVVMDPMLTYLRANFSAADIGAPRAYLNDRGVPPIENITIEEPVDGGVPYVCNQMAAVWRYSRCMNFNDVPGTDGFFDFNNYATLDPRRERPQGLTCPIAQMLYNGKDMAPAFNDSLNSAYNEDQALFMLPAPNEPFDDAAPYLEDDIVTHLDYILPVGCPLAVPTGVTVQRPDINGGQPYDEHVCTNPGCSATPAGTCQQ